MFTMIVHGRLYSDSLQDSYGNPRYPHKTRIELLQSFCRRGAGDVIVALSSSGRVMPRATTSVRLRITEGFSTRAHFSLV